jgi:4-hydroxy-L-threonine phosphate dehydrogenase PdxA
MSQPPLIGLSLGDPTGIGPEIVAKLLASTDLSDVARVIVVGDRRLLRMGAQIAGVSLDLPVLDDPGQIAQASAPALLHVNEMAPEEVTLGRVSAAAGRTSKATFARTLHLAHDGFFDGMTHAPMNKEAISRGGSPFAGDLDICRAELGWDGRCGELNVLDDLWTSRVTSHVPMAEVSALLTIERVLESIEFMHDTIANVCDDARIAVAAYNPHSGEGGLVGREELDAISPAVRLAQERGIRAEGPFAADTIFPMAMERSYQAIVTMYHDQGQIAMKLLGFHRGVTVLGGLPVKLTTEGHGTAHDIAGQGVADPAALEAAIRLVARMAGGVPG